MSMYKINSRAVRVKLMQYHYYSGSYKYSIPLEDILSDTFSTKNTMSWLEPKWKLVDGRDMDLYFQRCREINEIVDFCSEVNSENYYFNKLKAEKEKIDELGSSLNEVYLNSVPKSRRPRIFQKYNAMKIEVE